MHTKNHTTHKNIKTKLHKAHIIRNQKSLCGLYTKQHKVNKTPTIENRKATNRKERINFSPSILDNTPISKQEEVVNI